MNNVKTFFNQKLWIEGSAVEQLTRVFALPHVCSVVGLPDLHPGVGYPVGAVVVTKDWVYPALIGGDIGCGMTLLELDIQYHKLKIKKIYNKINFESDYESDLANQVALSYRPSLGTIGGGNHFIELQKVDEIIDSDLWDNFGSSHKSVFALIHTGSRGLGAEVLREHIEIHNHEGLADSGVYFDKYIARHDEALNFAKLNRDVLAERLSSQLKVSYENKLSIYHNFLEAQERENQKYWIHRKGAAKLAQGYAVVPGSRGDWSYLVYAVADKIDKSWWSIAHGAGRKWQRGECCARLAKKYKTSELTRTSLGSFVVCENKALLYEEAPEAYKSIDHVIEALSEHGLIKVVAKFRPLMSYKTRHDK